MYRYFQYFVLACEILRLAHGFSLWSFDRSSRHYIDTCSILSSNCRSQIVHLSDHRGVSLTRPTAPTSTTSVNFCARTMSSSVIWPPVDRLNEYVTESFLVDYKKLVAEEKDWLAGVITSIKETDPVKLEKADRHAFLINAYNLWTLHWVIRERRWPWWKGHVSIFAKARFFYLHKISTGQGRRNLFDFENKVTFAFVCSMSNCTKKNYGLPITPTKNDMLKQNVSPKTDSKPEEIHQQGAIPVN